MVTARGSRATTSSLSVRPGPPDPKFVEAGAKGLWVEAPEGAGGEEAVEGGGHKGCSGVSGGRVGWAVAVGRAMRAPRVEAAGEDEVSEGEEGGPGSP